MAYPAVRLRPLGVGDLFDETVRLWRRHLLHFAAVGAVVMVPTTAASLLPSLLGTSRSGPLVVGLIALAYPASYLAGLLGMGALISAASAVCLGRRLSIREAYAVGLRRFLPLLGLTVVYTPAMLAPLLPAAAAIVGVGLYAPQITGDAADAAGAGAQLVRTLLFLALIAVALLLTVVGLAASIYLTVIWAFSYPALLLERTGIRRALGRSRALVRGQWWRVFGVTLLFFLFVGAIVGFLSALLWIPAGIIMVASEPAGATAASVVLGIVTNAGTTVITWPLMYSGYVLLYYDLRVRKEAFDLELQIRDLEQAPVAERALG